MNGQSSIVQSLRDLYTYYHRHHRPLPPPQKKKKKNVNFFLVGGNSSIFSFERPPPWDTADTKIKENPELKGSPFKSWSRSECSHTCFTYCQGFLP